MTQPMNIGQAAQAAGVSPKMIRHYEQIGLLAEAARSDAGYRQYGERDVSVLRFIRQSRRLGFSMEQIAGLLGLWSNHRRTSREVKALAQQHLDDLAAKMRELAQMQAALEKLVASCHGDDDPHCAILQQLAVSSAEPPVHAAVVAKPLRKAAVPAARRSDGASSAHLDLMAWARSAQPSHH